MDAILILRIIAFCIGCLVLWACWPRFRFGEEDDIPVDDDDYVND